MCSVCVSVCIMLYLYYEAHLYKKKWSFEKIYVVSKSTDQCLS